MNILLDTQMALWAITDSPRLSDKARSLISDEANRIFFSSACVWEIAIKHRLARGDIAVSGEQALRYFRAAGYIELPINSLHAAATEKLPAHHEDPFDRILVAQALTEPLKLLTSDKKLPAYGDTIILA